MKLNKSLGYYFIVQIQSMISANVSLKRIEVKKITILTFEDLHANIYFEQKFLLEDEIIKTNDYNESNKPCIELENVSSSWTNVSIHLYLVTDEIVLKLKLKFNYYRTLARTV